MRRRHTRPAAGGFTLVELCIVLAVAGVLAAIAWPSMREQLLRGRRGDAVAALVRIQMAQESHRALHGHYAPQLGALAGATGTLSREGLYALALRTDTPGGYEARATARDGTAAAGDERCPALVLRVREGVADYAPNRRCWNR
jgi:type IV pilus assembly protein PilE